MMEILTSSEFTERSRFLSARLLGRSEELPASVLLAACVSGGRVRSALCREYDGAFFTVSRWNDSKSVASLFSKIDKKLEVVKC